MLHSRMVESFEADIKMEGSTGEVVRSLIACRETQVSEVSAARGLERAHSPLRAL
jgi:hypothetical protein